MMLDIPVFFIEANQAYFDAKSKLFQIIETASFTEHHSTFRSIFLRHDKRLKIGDTIAVFVEPQINMTASIREGCFISKLQLTCLKYFQNFHDDGRILRIYPFSHKMTFPDFIDGIAPCESWREMIDKIAPINDFGINQS